MTAGGDSPETQDQKKLGHHYATCLNSRASDAGGRKLPSCVIWTQLAALGGWSWGGGTWALEAWLAVMLRGSLGVCWPPWSSPPPSPPLNVFHVPGVPGLLWGGTFPRGMLEDNMPTQQGSEVSTLDHLGLPEETRLPEQLGFGLMEGSEGAPHIGRKLSCCLILLLCLSAHASHFGVSCRVLPSP